MFYEGFSIITGVLALVLLLIGLKMLVRSGWLFAWLRGMSGVMFLVLAASLSWVAWDIRHYRELPKDKPIATVSIQQISAQAFNAILIMGDDVVPLKFKLYGDQWQLDARILRWTGVMQTIGGKPGYRLDRISGRYSQLTDELNKPRSVHTLIAQNAKLDLWYWLYAAKGKVPGVQALYGSATFVPMADGALYQVGLSGSGLVATPLNDAAKNAINAW